MLGDVGGILARVKYELHEWIYCMGIKSKTQSATLDVICTTLAQVSVSQRCSAYKAFSFCGA